MLGRHSSLKMCAISVVVLAVALGPSAKATLAAALAWGQTSELLLPSNAGSSESPAFQAQTASAGSVSCWAMGSCVAVGRYLDNSHNNQGMVVEDSSGTWGQAREIELPSGAMTGDEAELLGVACPGSGACVAAGTYYSGSQAIPMVVDQSGGTWAQAGEITPPPDAAMEDRAWLNSVACNGPGSCTTVGTYRTNSSDTQAMAVSETGGTWSQAVEIVPPANAASGSAGDATLNSIVCPGTGFCVAVGEYADNVGHTRAMLAEESNGMWHRASEIALPPNASSNPVASLHSVACMVPGSCVAVGEYSDGLNGQPMVVEEAGGVWGQASEIASSTSAAYHWLGSVSCPAPGQCVAVGTDNSATMVMEEANETWGESSQILPPATKEEAALLSVACPVLGSCVAVGQYTANSNESDYEAMVVTAGPQSNLLATTSTSSTPPTAVEGTNPTTPTVAQATVGTASLVRRSMTVQRGHVIVILSCRGPQKCSGTLTFSIETRNGRGKHHKRTHRITIGTIHFSIPPGAIAVKVKLNTAGRARLRISHGHSNALLTIQQPIVPNRATTTEQIRLIEHAAAPQKR
jgi:hypothetical protein